MMNQTMATKRLKQGHGEITQLELARTELAHVAPVVDVEIPTDTEVAELVRREADERAKHAVWRDLRNAASSYLAAGDKAAFQSLAQVADLTYDRFFGPDGYWLEELRS